MGLENLLRKQTVFRKSSVELQKGPKCRKFRAAFVVGDAISRLDLSTFICLYCNHAYNSVNMIWGKAVTFSAI